MNVNKILILRALHKCKNMGALYSHKSSNIGLFGLGDAERGFEKVRLQVFFER